MSGRLSVGVNLAWLVPGVVGGSEEYTVRLLEAAADHLDGVELTIYGSRALFEAQPVLERAGRRREVPLPAAGSSVASKAIRVGVEHTWLAAATAGHDLVHHAGGVVPSVRSTPAVVTIHDLQPLDLPRNFSLLKRRWLGFMLPRSAGAARAVITPSRFTADAVARHLGVGPDRIRVVSQGARALPVGITDREATDRLRQRFGRFLLFPAIAHPHKNHRHLVEALARLGPDHADVAVVCTGRPGSAWPAAVDLAHRLGVADRVHHLGRVPAPELDQLYRAAVALVFPSSYEGFGNPLLEAMARGTPVVAADATAVAEVVGDAGILVPVGRTDALAAAVSRLLDDDDLARELARAGPRRAADYDWADSGARLVDTYRWAAAARRVT